MRTFLAVFLQHLVLTIKGLHSLIESLLSGLIKSQPKPRNFVDSFPSVSYDLFRRRWTARDLSLRLFLSVWEKNPKKTLRGNSQRLFAFPSIWENMNLQPLEHLATELFSTSFINLHLRTLHRNWQKDVFYLPGLAKETALSRYLLLIVKHIPQQILYFRFRCKLIGARQWPES